MSNDILSDPTLAIIFAYAPAGLGHLRVTDALRHGIESDANAILLPTSGESIRFIHRLTSVNPFFRRLMTWVQYGAPQRIGTRFYRRWLLSEAGAMERELYGILKQRIQRPKTLLIVATHFGIAHQVGAIKARLEKRADVRVILVVQVTDDSPQSIWYVPGSDITFVPSELTKDVLTEYGRKEKLPAVPMEVEPYPISPVLARRLKEPEIKARLASLSLSGELPIQVVVPVSGAAVGVAFGEALVKHLHHISLRYFFHIVAKRSIFTDVFLSRVEHLAYVRTYASHSDREIVELYEQAYTQNLISLEVTKPSEQAFKALLCPDQVGGAILLFMQPVGRQEYDNLDFLKRHKLIPTDEQQDQLWELARKHHDLPVAEKKSWVDLVSSFRGLRLPNEPKAAAYFINWCLRQGFFASMHTCRIAPVGDSAFASEVSSQGVAKFWSRVETLIVPKKS